MARITSISRCLAVVLTLMATAHPARASEPVFRSGWASEHATRARLIGGAANSTDGKPRLFAGVEIEMDAGWKTYWRNPGSSGVPPRLDWAGSENLAEAILHFPAPQRFPDRDGDTIGYKSAVILPVAIRPMDPKLPVRLKLALEYGVCKDVCIPVQPALELTLPPDAAARSAGLGLQAAIDRIPRDPAQQRPGDPRLASVVVDLKGAKPSISIEAAFPGEAKGADVYLEAPDGLWVPLAKPDGGAKGDRRRFVVDLTDGADIADLKGRTIRLTLVGSGGQTETSFKME